MENTNKIEIIGDIVNGPVLDHEIYGEKFYVFSLEVVRLSSTTDIIPITISERLLTENGLPIDSKISVHGQFRSYNCYQGENNRFRRTYKRGYMVYK